MNKRIVIACLTLLLPISGVCADSSKEQGSNGVTIERVEDSGAFSGVFSRFWSKMRNLSPRLMANSADGRGQTQVAGIRGNETTESLLAPYWKSDLENDKEFTAELDALSKANTMADSGDFAAASKAYDEFLDNHPNSKLKPNVQFASAITSGAMGNAAKGKATLQSMIEESPQHPLATDAKELLTQM